MDRRQFLVATAAATAGVAAGHSAVAQTTSAVPVPARKFYSNLVPGLLGPFHPTFDETISLASQYGFGGLDPNASALDKLTPDGMSALLERLQAQHLQLGEAGLPVNFRGDETQFSDGLKQLPAFAATMQRAGVTRMSTWLAPSSNTLTYMQNFRQHAYRMRACALVLADHGQRLGLEYVAPRTSWQRGRYAFIHTMAEMKELIAAVGTGNVGFRLDSWHWFNARETAADLLSLRATDVVTVDLNDAPTGLTFDTYQDGQRELPAATGVIPVKTFLDALATIGYDGPVEAEPNNPALRQMSMDAALTATAAALKKAFGEM